MAIVVLVYWKSQSVFFTVLTSDMVSVETDGLRRNSSWTSVVQQVMLSTRITLPSANTSVCIAVGTVCSHAE
jgi:hypothetical protein